MGLVKRAASLAAVPVTTSARLATAATAAALGADKDEMYAKATAASVESLTRTLAKARGPALKFGQAIAVFSSALPAEQAAQLSALTRLYEDAQPQPLSKLKKQLKQLPPGVDIDSNAIAAASLGQVHRGTWSDGTEVAIKLQYADAARVVKTDMAQLKAMAPLIGKLVPTLDVSALVAEHATRLAEELDYRCEARNQKQFRKAWKGSSIVVPRVMHATPTLLITQWLDGTPWAQVPDLPAHRRDAAGRSLARFCFWSPKLVGATHADPHPGNFRLLPNNQLGVLDFGSVAHNSGLFTRLFAQTLILSTQDRNAEVFALWKDAGLVSPGARPAHLQRILDPDYRPYLRDEFTFTKEWLASRAAQFHDPASALEGAGKLRFPPSYLLEHRAVMGTIALLCAIDTTVDFKTVLDRVE